MTHEPHTKQVKLVAETGWLLKSKISGKTYRAIDTLDVKRWEVVEDPDYQKSAPKAETEKVEVQNGDPSVVLPVEKKSKPQTKKRTNRKGK